MAERRATFIMMAHTAIYLTVAYYLSISKIAESLDTANVTMCSVITIGCSFLHLVYQTCQVYKENGKWIIINICIVSVFIGALVEITGICSPGLKLMTKVYLLQGAMLTSRLTLDINKQAFGANIQ
jgi:hypothetical protein